MATRQAKIELTAYTMELQKRTIPTHAILHDFKTGPGHEGLATHNPDVASFRFDGELYTSMSCMSSSGGLCESVRRRLGRRRAMWSPVAPCQHRPLVSIPRQAAQTPDTLMG
jgi:hypothetical protein